MSPRAAHVEEPPYLESEDGLKHWPPTRRKAWFGLLQAHAHLTRALDAELIANHGLSLSAYQALARLAHAEEGRLRMSTLAELCVLSQSRVSRIVDQLEQRELAARRDCTHDCRVVHATITERGRELLREAQETHFRGVQERFFASLTRAEVEHLARIWAKVSACDSGACRS